MGKIVVSQAEFEMEPEKRAVYCYCMVKVTGKTGGKNRTVENPVRRARLKYTAYLKETKSRETNML